MIQLIGSEIELFSRKSEPNSSWQIWLRVSKAFPFVNMGGGFEELLENYADLDKKVTCVFFAMGSCWMGRLAAAVHLTQHFPATKQTQT